MFANSCFFHQTDDGVNKGGSFPDLTGTSDSKSKSNSDRSNSPKSGIGTELIYPTGTKSKLSGKPSDNRSKLDDDEPLKPKLNDSTGEKRVAGASEKPSRPKISQGETSKSTKGSKPSSRIGDPSKDNVSPRNEDLLFNKDNRGDGKEWSGPQDGKDNKQHDNNIWPQRKPPQKNGPPHKPPSRNDPPRKPPGNGPPRKHDVPAEEGGGDPMDWDKHQDDDVWPPRKPPHDKPPHHKPPHHKPHHGDKNKPHGDDGRPKDRDDDTGKEHNEPWPKEKGGGVGHPRCISSCSITSKAKMKWCQRTPQARSRGGIKDCTAWSKTWFYNCAEGCAQGRGGDGDGGGGSAGDGGDGKEDQDGSGGGDGKDHNGGANGPPRGCKAACRINTSEKLKWCKEESSPEDRRTYNIGSCFQWAKQRVDRCIRNCDARNDDDAGDDDDDADDDQDSPDTGDGASGNCDDICASRLHQKLEWCEARPIQASSARKGSSIKECRVWGDAWFSKCIARCEGKDEEDQGDSEDPDDGNGTDNGKRLQLWKVQS